MPLYKLIYILLVPIFCFVQPLHAQDIDSLMGQRESKLHAYSHFKDTMQQRTWINLVDLGKRAQAVIDADNELVNTLLINMQDRNSANTILHEEMNLQLAMLESENQKRKLQLTEYTKLNQVLLIIIIGLTAGLITALVLLTNQYRKNRLAGFELERLWSMNDDQSIALREREKNLEKQIRLLEIENKTMHKEFMLISDQKSHTKKQLQEEIDSRRKVEKEIKDLLGQIKKQ